MHCPEAALAQLPKLCCKAQTDLEDGESALDRAAPEDLAGLKSLLPLARTRKLQFFRLLMGEEEQPGRRAKDYCLTRSWKTFFQRSFQLQFFSFSSTVILPDMFFHIICEYSQNSVQQEYTSMGKGVTFYYIYKYFIQAASKCTVALQWCFLGILSDHFY